MKLSAPFGFALLFWLSGCSEPSFNVVDKDRVRMFELREGACFTGCHVLLSRPDGVTCSGFATALNEGLAASVQVNCPGEPLQRLTTEPLQLNSSVLGVLVPEKPLDERNRDAIQSASAHAQ